MTDGYFSQIEYAKIIQARNDWNPWSLVQTQAFKDAIVPAKFIGPTLAGTSDSNTIDAKISGDIMQLSAGPLQYAAGYQWSDGNAEDQPERRRSSPATSPAWAAPRPRSTESRTVNAIYGELAIPVFKSLDFTVQGRYDDYDDVGSKFTYKGSLRWQPAKEYLLRASYDTGFRPPTLPDLWSPQTLGTSEQFTDPAHPDNPNIQVPNISGGNPLLEAGNVEAMADRRRLVADGELQLRRRVLPHQARRHHHDAVGAGSGVASTGWVTRRIRTWSSWRRARTTSTRSARSSTTPAAPTSTAGISRPSGARSSRSATST